MIRKQIYTIQEVHKNVRPYIPRQLNLVIFDGDEIDMESQRYALFKRDKCICVKCQLEASYYAKEKSKGQEDSKRWHFNLYGVKAGREIMFTKDHIVPRSLGGKDILSNYQIMCSECNGKKRNISNEVYMGINFLPDETQVQLIMNRSDMINLVTSNQPAMDVHQYLSFKNLGQYYAEETMDHNIGWHWNIEPMRTMKLLDLWVIYNKIKKDL